MIKTTRQKKLFIRESRLLVTKQHRSCSGVFALLIGVCSLVGATTASAVDIDTLSYRLEVVSLEVGPSYAVVTGRADGNSSPNIIIPDAVYMDGVKYLVTRVGTNAFYNKGIKSVQLGENLDFIEKGAFRRNSIVELILPDSLTSVDRDAFYENSITTVVIPENATFVETNAFGKNPLETVLFLGMLSENFSYGAFYNATKVPTIEYCLDKSSGWESKVFAIIDGLPAKDVTGITCQFTFSSGNEYRYNLENKLSLMSYTGKNVIVYDSAPINGTPIDITRIGNNAFDKNAIESVDFRSNNLTRIGNYAFRDSLLTSVTIPNSVTRIGDYAFSGSPGFSFGSNAADGNGQLTSLTIPNSVTTIGRGAFTNNQLTSVIIPGEVTSIGDSAFANNQLTSVTIPDSMTIIDSSLFSNNQLISVTIPDSVTSIGYQAFKDNQLKSVTIPDSVTSIGYNAFSDNSGLTSVAFLGNYNANFSADAFLENPILFSIDVCKSAKGWGPNVFSGKTIKYVSCPVTDTDGYQYVENSDGGLTLTSYAGTATEVVVKSFVTINDEPTYITRIGNNAFKDKGITSVKFSDDPRLISIGDYAFAENQLTSVTIPNSVTSIGQFAFNKNKLTSVTIPDSVTSISVDAFSENELTSVTIPDNVTSIGEGAFYGNKLTSVTIPDRVTSIGKFAFGFNQLTSVTIPNSVTSIDENAFAYNVLTSVAFLGDYNEEFNQDAFKLTSLSNSIDVCKSAQGWKPNVFTGKTINEILCGAEAFIGKITDAAENNDVRYITIDDFTALNEIGLNNFNSDNFDAYLAAILASNGSVLDTLAGIQVLVDNVNDNVGAYDSTVPRLVIFNNAEKSAWPLWDCCGGSTPTVEMDDAEHGAVAEFKVENKAETVQGFYGRDSGSFDASALLNTGVISFEMKVVTAPADGTPWIFKIEAFGNISDSGELNLNTSNEGVDPVPGVWQTYTFDLQTLADGGLDIRAIDVLMIFPKYGEGLGAVYRVDNVIIEEGKIRAPQQGLPLWLLKAAKDAQEKKANP